MRVHLYFQTRSTRDLDNDQPSHEGTQGPHPRFQGFRPSCRRCWRQAWGGGARWAWNILTVSDSWGYVTRTVRPVWEAPTCLTWDNLSLNKEQNLNRLKFIVYLNPWVQKDIFYKRIHHLGWKRTNSLLWKLSKQRKPAFTLPFL